MLSIRIPLGRHKVAEWSLAILLRRLIKIGYINKETAKAKMVIAMQNTMAKYALKQKKKGNHIRPVDLKAEAIRSLGQSGMELWEFLGLNQSHLYALATKAHEAKK